MPLHSTQIFKQIYMMMSSVEQVSTQFLNGNEPQSTNLVQRRDQLFRVAFLKWQNCLPFCIKASVLSLVLHTLSGLGHSSTLPKNNAMQHECMVSLRRTRSSFVLSNDDLISSPPVSVMHSLKWDSGCPWASRNTVESFYMSLPWNLSLCKYKEQKTTTWSHKGFTWKIAFLKPELIF